MSRFTRFSLGKNLFVDIGPCKRFDIFHLCQERPELEKELVNLRKLEKTKTYDKHILVSDMEPRDGRKIQGPTDCLCLLSCLWNGSRTVSMFSWKNYFSLDQSWSWKSFVNSGKRRLFSGESPLSGFVFISLCRGWLRATQPGYHSHHPDLPTFHISNIWESHILQFLNLLQLHIWVFPEAGGGEEGEEVGIGKMEAGWGLSSRGFTMAGISYSISRHQTQRWPRLFLHPHSLPDPSQPLF